MEEENLTNTSCPLTSLSVQWYVSHLTHVKNKPQLVKHYSTDGTGSHVAQTNHEFLTHCLPRAWTMYTA